MSVFSSMLKDAALLRRSQSPHLSEIAEEIGALYVDLEIGGQVRRALMDPFLPLTLFLHHYVHEQRNGEENVARAGQNLARLSQMHLRIRRDISRYVGNTKATCVDLNGNSLQQVTLDQWCRLCGQCCQLSGTIPDSPHGITYPGYWYTFIAGDGPVVQRFCPFLFELPPQGIFFCSIHHVKPRTCLAYGEEECSRNHPERAKG